MTVKKYAECQNKQECVCIGMQFLIERPIAVHQCPINISGVLPSRPNDAFSIWRSKTKE